MNNKFVFSDTENLKKFFFAKQIFAEICFALFFSRYLDNYFFCKKIFCTHNYDTNNTKNVCNQDLFILNFFSHRKNYPIGFRQAVQKIKRSSKSKTNFRFVFIELEKLHFYHIHLL